MIQWLRLCASTAWDVVWSPVGELRSHVARVAKKKKQESLFKRCFRNAWASSYPRTREFWEWVCLSSGLFAVLPLGGDRAALPADCGWVDRAWAPVRLCQGVHHPEVREVHQTLARGTVPVIGLCCHHRQVLLHFYINRRHQVPPAKKLFPMFCQFTAFHISKLHFLNYSMFMDGWYGERQTESFEMNCCSVTKSWLCTP